MCDSINVSFTLRNCRNCALSQGVVIQRYFDHLFNDILKPAFVPLFDIEDRPPAVLLPLVVGFSEPLQCSGAICSDALSPFG